jgi:hypothetical protein
MSPLRIRATQTIPPGPAGSQARHCSPQRPGGRARQLWSGTPPSGGAPCRGRPAAAGPATREELTCRQLLPFTAPARRSRSKTTPDYNGDEEEKEKDKKEDEGGEEEGEEGEEGDEGEARHSPRLAGQPALSPQGSLWARLPSPHARPPVRGRGP